jgi:hypothetical protein
MIPFKDKTFCASPKCKNECGRKMTKKEEEQLERMNETHWVGVSQGYFCGEPEEDELND